MKKKILSLFVTFTMLCGFISIFPVTSANASGYNDFYQIYLADYLSENTVAASYLNQEINMPYRKYVEDRITNPVYISLLSAWQLATFELSDVSELSFKQVGYYETILFDILYTENKSESNLENIDKLVKSTHASAIKDVYELYGDCLTQDLSELQKDSEKYNNILSTISDLEEFQNAFKILGKASKYLGYCKDIDEILYKCSILETVAGKNEYLSRILDDISEYTTDPALELACNNFLTICRGSLTDDEVKSIFLGEWAAKEASDTILSKIWDAVVDECTQYGLAISVGQGMGKLGANLLFSTEEDIEHLFSCCALYEFENQLNTVTHIYKNTFESFRNLEDAELFNTAFDLLLKTQLEGVQYSRKIAEIEYDKGAINQLFKYFKQEDYDGYIKTLDMMDEMIEDYIEFINVTQYNCFIESIAETDAYKDQIYVSSKIDISPEPVTLTSSQFSSIVAQIQSVSDSYYGKKIDEDWTLTEDFETHGDIKITSGTVDLDAHSLTIYGDLIQSGGTLIINNGKLNVGENYTIENTTTNNVGETEYHNCYAELLMKNKYDKININGDFITHKIYTSNVWDGIGLNYGTFSVGGDIWTDTGFCSSIPYDDEIGDYYNRIILNGSGNQKIYMVDSLFNELEIVNSAERIIECSGDLNIYKLVSNINIKSNNLNLKNIDLNQKIMNINGDVTSIGQIDLNGGTLDISGNLQQTDGDIYVNNGTLNVGGEYKIEIETVNNIGETLYKRSLGQLHMINEYDKVNVDGDFIWHGDADLIGSEGLDCVGNFTAGILTIGGNFIDRIGKDETRCAFQTRGTHKVVLNGTGNQSIIVPDDYYDRYLFTQLEVVNPENRQIICENFWNVQKMLSDININPVNIKLGDIDVNGKTITINGNATQYGDININGGTLNILGNLRQLNEDMIINNGTLNVIGDYRIEKETVNNIGEIEYSYVDAKIFMENKHDKINVGGDFVWSGLCGRYTSGEPFGYCTNGILTIAGDFIERLGVFIASDEHKTILNGNEHQNVTFENGGIFNILELTKDISNYTFNPEPCWNELITTPAVTTVITTTVTTTTTTTQPITTSTSKTTTSPSVTTTTPITTVVTTEPIENTGDLNNDGKINVADLVLLQKYLTRKTDDISTTADLNNDRIINVFDVVILRRKIFSVLN